MPIREIPSTDLTYYLIAFDADGNERVDDPDGLMSDVIVEKLAIDPITDVFILSHGWRGDLAAAQSQYDRWIQAMAIMSADRDAIRQQQPDFQALLIGFHWPSEPWGEEDFEDVDFSIDDAPDIETLVDRWAERIADTPAARDALRVILESAEDDPVPAMLPDEVVDAYRTLDREAGLGSDGVTGAPGADREPFDPEMAYQDSFEADFGFGLDLGGLLTPLKQLSFWKMKSRARAIGEDGGHAFLNRLLSMPGKDSVRVHLMGHSFGCIVVSSMAAGPPDGAGPVRKVGSLALVQGATSHWAYCADIPHAPGNAGYFHPLIARNDVSGPILVTTSTHDRALGWWYPKAAGVAGQVDFDPNDPGKYGALGISGIRGPGVDTSNQKIRTSDEDYEFGPGDVVNLDCDTVIKDGNKFSGAHSDIAHPEVAHAVWQAVMATP